MHRQAPKICCGLMFLVSAVSTSQAQQAQFSIETGKLTVPVLSVEGVNKFDTEFSYIPGSGLGFEISDLQLADDSAEASGWYEFSTGNTLRLNEVLVSGAAGGDTYYTALFKSPDNLLQASLVGAVPIKDAETAISLTQLGTYATGVFDEGAAEIVTYDPASQRLFVSNAFLATVDILSISDPASPSLVDTIDITSLGVSANSVAVKNGVLAIAVEAANKQSEGLVAFYDVNGDFINSVVVGALPDMVAWSPDGNTVLVANEGEPNGEYTVDPEGSIGIIDVSEGVESATVRIADFSEFESQQGALMAEGLRIFGPGAGLSEDLEPEYIAVSADSTTAWVTLQEANAIAIVDIATAEVTDIVPLGYKDHSLAGNELDASNEDDAINLRNWPVLGMYQPDALASFSIDGESYLITVNEGDSRDYDGFSEEARVKDVVLDSTVFPDAASLQQDENLGRINMTTTLGDTDDDGDFDQIYVYGGRSFSILDASAQRIYDSGKDLAIITASQLGAPFNNEDSRSDDKGAEPEAVTTGIIAGRTYAFIGLERTSGIVIYDVSVPSAPVFVEYVNNRDWSLDEEDPDAGDIGPEAIVFIPAADSPDGIPLLAVSNEVSGSTTIYQINTP